MEEFPEICPRDRHSFYEAKFKPFPKYKIYFYRLKRRGVFSKAYTFNYRFLLIFVFLISAVIFVSEGLKTGNQIFAMGEKVSLVLGVKTVENQPSNDGKVYINNVVKVEEKSNSPAPANDQTNLYKNLSLVSPSPEIKLKNESKQVESPKPTLTPTTLFTKEVSKAPLDESKVSEDKIINASGEVQEYGQKVRYELSFHKKGGEVKGTIGGACNGPIDGNFDGKNAGLINGTITGNCQVGIFKQNINATYRGSVHLSTGIIDITWNGNVPFSNGSGSFTLNFTPI